MTNDLFLDIETVPDIDAKEYAESIEISAPGNYKNQESIDKYIAEKRSHLSVELVKEASLNPLYGKVVSVAMRYDGNTYSCASKDELTVIGYTHEFITRSNISWENTRLVTFNGKAFDVPFMNIRAGYELLPNVGKYDQRVHLDVMLYLNNFGSFRATHLGMSQAAVARKLGVPEVYGHGSDVYGWYKSGDLESIKKHNISDVEQLELICQKLGIVTEPLPF